MFQVITIGFWDREEGVNYILHAKVQRGAGPTGSREVGVGGGVVVGGGVYDNHTSKKRSRLS